jgi:hypothetical protein
MEEMIATLSKVMYNFAFCKGCPLVALSISQYKLNMVSSKRTSLRTLAVLLDAVENSLAFAPRF